MFATAKVKSNQAMLDFQQRPNRLCDVINFLRK